MSGKRLDEKFISGLAGISTVGRYKIQGKLGQGSTGVVYLGLDPFIQRRVAIKLSQPDSEKARKNFFIEAQSAGRLNHPNIVSIYDAGLYGDYCYIAMEYVEGSTLEKFCRPDSLFPVDIVMEIALSVCNALDYAHKQKVIHRDIKPSNILLTNTVVPKISDFSIAYMAEKTARMGIWGTPSYMSPEQLRGETIAPNSDIFSLGCVLFQLLSGQQAFQGDNHFAVMYKISNEAPPDILELRPELPKFLGTVVHKALAKDARERYQSSMDLACDLQVVLRHLRETPNAERGKGFIDYVHHVPFFQNFSREQLEELVVASKIGKVRKGKTIVAEGDVDDCFYIILSGSARIHKNDTTLATLGAGACFGEMAYICGQPRVATATAETDCILIKISASLLNGASESIQLLFYKNFATTLVERLSRTC